MRSVDDLGWRMSLDGYNHYFFREITGTIPTACDRVSSFALKPWDKTCPDCWVCKLAVGGGEVYALRHPLLQKQLKGISKRAFAVYEYILEVKGKFGGIGPSIREIAKAVGLSDQSTATVASHLRTLEKRGLIRCMKGIPRGIIVIGGKWFPPKGDDPPEYY